MENLKPCPFCGEIPTVTHDAQNCETYVIQCANGECACMPVTWWYLTKEEAIEAWNRRAGKQDG